MHKQIQVLQIKLDTFQIKLEILQIKLDILYFSGEILAIKNQFLAKSIRDCYSEINSQNSLKNIWGKKLEILYKKHDLLLIVQQFEEQLNEIQNNKNTGLFIRLSINRLIS